MAAIALTATQYGEPRPGCAEAGWFSYFTFGYITPVVTKGRFEQIDQTDAPRLSALEDTVQNSHLLLGCLEEAERARHAHPLLRSIVASFWRPLAVFEGLKMLGHCYGLVNPLLMKQVLIFQESQNSGKEMSTADVRWGLNCVVALVMLGLFHIVWNSQVEFFQNRLDLRIAGALRGAVIKRSVQGSSPGAAGSATAKGGTDTPTVYNVISFDVGPNVSILWVILGMWLFPFQFVSTVSVIFSQVGWAVVPGICVVIVAKLVSGLLLFFDGFYRHRQLHAKDQRLGRCNEGFTNIRTLQMLTWVPPFEDRIMQARREELRLQRTRLWLQKMSSALDYSLSVIVTLVTLAYFVTVDGGQMKASTALPLISLVSSLIGPFGQFPGWINHYLVWKSAYQRLRRRLPGPRDLAAAGPPRPGCAAARRAPGRGRPGRRLRGLHALLGRARRRRRGRRGGPRRRGVRGSPRPTGRCWRVWRRSGSGCRGWTSRWARARCWSSWAARARARLLCSRACSARWPWSRAPYAPRPRGAARRRARRAPRRACCRRPATRCGGCSRGGERGVWEPGHRRVRRALRPAGGDAHERHRALEHPLRCSPRAQALQDSGSCAPAR
ncbi:unnamed protein product [Prorocentrum cordatum]|uniref:ABC transmembrane type-1 domain-containing protein n=1 Tax=Prorocentrum cordatum TaxID=2364126 RepID=A0ABN9SW03_9DINO|nr:unnamed protein product [Polarella glacialis]